MRVKLDPGAYLPERAHSTDAGLDLRSREDAVVRAHGSYTFDTGVHIELPPHTAGLLKSKSGLNVHHNITSDGVIDVGYTGSIAAKLYNHGDKNFVVHAGDKITQLVVVPILTPEMELADALDETARGDNGFGSTGVR